MITIEKHLEQNRENIEREAQVYAIQYNMSIERARREVADEYCQGWCESVDAARYE